MLLEMRLQAVNYSDQLFQAARDFFLQQGRSDFLQKKPLSLCARYRISQKMRKLGFLDFIPEDGVYQCGEYTFAISYSVDKLFFAVDRDKVVVDVEKIIARDVCLLQDERKVAARDWEEFYVQRCAKECLVKWLNLRLDEFQRITVEKVLLWEGQQEVILEYQEESYAVEAWVEKGYVYAVMGEKGWKGEKLKSVKV